MCVCVCCAVLTLMFMVCVVAGGCSFDDGPSQCDYQQDPYDDFDWTHVSAQEVPYLSPELPQGQRNDPKILSEYCLVSFKHKHPKVLIV